MFDFQDAVESFVDSWARGNLHTIMPGIIKEITDRKTPMANVQPCFMRLREGEEEPEPWPELPSIPIVFPHFGTYQLVSDIDVDTPVLLVISERSIKTWIHQGGVVDPILNHMFKPSDAFAIAGLINLASPLGSDIPTGGIALRKQDGTVSISITDTVIKMSNENGTVSIADNGTVEASNGNGSLTLKDSGQVDANGNLTVDP